LGFASLSILATVVSATIGVRWTEESDMANILAVIDGNISQAFQVRLAVVPISHHLIIQLSPELKRGTAVGSSAGFRDSMRHRRATAISSEQKL
jgi:hypothetical protein